MRLKTRVAVAAVAVGTLLASAACTTSDNSGSTPKNVEVFTWWADGGEKAGLDGLVDQFKKEASERGRNARELARLLDRIRSEGGRLGEGALLPNGGHLRVATADNVLEPRNRRVEISVR